MPNHEAVFGGVEGVVRKVLYPQAGVRGRKHAKPDLQHVHMDECDLCPIYKRSRQSQIYDTLALPDSQKSDSPYSHTTTPIQHRYAHPSHLSESLHFSLTLAGSGIRPASHIP